MIVRLHYDCDPDDPNRKGEVVEFWLKVNPPPAAAFFGAPNKGCAIGPELCKFFAAESLNTLPGVGGTAEGVEPPDVPNVNVAGAFPVSDFEFPVPDAALKEKKGFVAGAGIFPGANDIDFVLPVSGAFTPNSVAELTGASFEPDCP